MENQEFQTHILERIQKLERQSFGGSFEQNYDSAREQAKAISDGDAKEHFIGKKTRESAIQRVKSFGQNYDEGAVKNLHGNEVIQYRREQAICKMLITKYKLTEDEVKA